MSAGKQSIPGEDISLFSRQLALIADSDVSMQEGLAIISEKSDSRQIKRIGGEMIENLNKGVSFYDSVKGYESKLGSLFIEMTGIGERSGNLPTMLERVADSIDKDNETKQKLRSAVVYPTILSVLMLAVIVLLIVYVLPMFDEILTSLGGEMPGVTRGIMNIGFFISNNILWIVLVIAILILIYVLTKITEKGRVFTDHIKLKLPIIRKIESANVASRFSRNLSMLLKSGMNITLSVEMLKAITYNKYIANKLDGVIRMLGKGIKPDVAFEELKLFPTLLVKLFSVANETGHMDAMLDKAADIMGKAGDEQMERLTTVLEPLLIIILSLLVGFILISVILPVTGIMNSIG
ncbi:MAG: type II secretion system F family protein [Clostridiales bacterium]|nr:type II secretion system F family protein [Clostridiales bacterium]